MSAMWPRNWKKPNRSPRVEDRAQEGPVGEVAALHQVRVVADDEVARGEVAVEGLDHLAGRVARREDVAGDVGRRHHDLALRVQPAEPEIAHQGEHVGLCGVEDLLAGLVQEALQAVPHHRERGRVQSCFSGGCAGRRERRAGAGHSRVCHVTQPFS